MKYLMLTASIVVNFVAQSSFATTWNQTDTYYTAATFSATAFGKEVQSVFAHTGVLKTPKNYSGMPTTDFWDNVQDSPMYLSNNTFVANVKTTASSCEGCATVDGMMIQYWVTFKDGSKMQTTPAAVPVDSLVYAQSDDDYTAKLKTFDQRFKAVQSNTNTTAVDVRFSWAD